MCEKDYIWNAATCSCENSKYLASTTYSVIMCDKILEEAKKIQKISMKKMQPVKQRSSIFHLPFY